MSENINNEIDETELADEELSQAGAGPHVKVFSALTGAEIQSYQDTSGAADDLAGTKGDPERG